MTTLATRGLNIPAYDFVENTYTGDDLTREVYRRGGSTGQIVATIDYTYIDGKIATISKS